MNKSRSRLVIAWAVLVGVIVGACERDDSRLKNLTVGITKDSAALAMGGDPNRTDPYLINGQYIQTMYYMRTGKTDSASRTLRRMAPVVSINGKIAGWGWPFWDSVASANRIPVPEKK